MVVNWHLNRWLGTESSYVVSYCSAKSSPFFFHRFLGMHLTNPLKRCTNHPAIADEDCWLFVSNYGPHRGGWLQPSPTSTWLPSKLYIVEYGCVNGAWCSGYIKQFSTKNLLHNKNNYGNRTILHPVYNMKLIKLGIIKLYRTECCIKRLHAQIQIIVRQFRWA